LTRFVTLTGMALRELWITFRLLLVVGALLLAALPAALLPHVMSPDLAGAPPDPLTWLAVSLSVALALAAGVAGGTLASERRRGTAGWVAARAVPRATVALTWFVAFAVLLAIGLLPLTLITWLSLSPFLPDGPMPMVAAVVGAGCAGLAAVAAGLLLGAALPPLPAGLLSSLATGAALLAGAVAQGASGAWWGLPVDGMRVLATLDTAARPVADALRAAGAALGLTAVLLVLCVVAFERADL
jgi:ABC-type transport system involved in multi-copper enzyme maturation permease subunit